MGFYNWLNALHSGIYLIALLYLPPYYAACATPFLRALTASRTRLGSLAAAIINKGREDNNVHVISQPQLVHLETAFTRSSSILPNNLLTLPLHPLKDVEAEWKGFIFRCQVEWLAISSLAFTFIMASPAALQAFSDPLPRSFIYIAIFQSICAIACSTAHVVYFRNPDTLTGNFAKTWFQDIDKHTNFVMATQFVVFALPAVALCQGAVAFIIALVSSVWHGSHHVPNTNGTGLQTIGLIPQLMLTAILFADVGCVLCILVTLHKAKRSRAVVLPRGVNVRD